MSPLAPCGVDCDNCHEFGRNCNGCRDIQGKVYWLGAIGQEVCPLYHCPVVEKGLDGCGHCGEMPCQKFYDLRDPALSDEQHQAEIAQRVKRLGR